MTKKFEKAKAETIQKYSNVLEAVVLARREAGGTCGFCHTYGDCEECPVDKLCGGILHKEVRDMLSDLEVKVEQGLHLLKNVKEKQPKKAKKGGE